METTFSIELFTAINFFVIGLSHLLQPKSWVAFFVYLHAKKDVGNIINALLSLGVGSLILSFHFLWHWPKILITIYGVLSVMKGLLYLLVPSIGISNIAKVTAETANRFRWAGMVMFVFSLVIIYELIKE
ncbi:MAG: hypothetical protein ICV53_13225 [Flavisolibacter sp.]|nr:hypothetical protein [Flavisolibacter sp.]